MTNLSEPQSVAPEPISPTAQPSADKLGLGRTSGQRGAEILAGFRAEKLPTPETLALSRWSGRITARLLMQMAKNNAPMNFTIARMAVIETLMRRAFLPGAEDVIAVEIAAGLSPRGLRLAQAFPQVKVIEVDLPDVIRDKQQRLSKVRNLVIPKNLEWRAADLGITPLSDVLHGQLVNVVGAEGLLPYFSHPEITRIARQIHDSLKPGGQFVADVPWHDGVEAIKPIMSFFSRQAGSLKGTMFSEAEARQTMVDAGYATVTIYRASQFTDELHLPQPLIDVSFFLMGQKALPA